MADKGWISAVSAREQKKRQRREEIKKQIKIQKLQETQAKTGQEEHKEKQPKSKPSKDELEDLKFTILVDPNYPLAQLGAKQQQLRKSRPSKKSQKPKKETNYTQKASLNVDAVRALLNEMGARYPNSYDVQLKILGEHFESGFLLVKTFKPEKVMQTVTAETLPSEFAKPLSQISKPVISLVKNWLGNVPKENLASFFWFTLAQITTSRPAEKIQIPTNGNGLRALLQLVVQKHPAAIFKDENFDKLIRPYGISPKAGTMIPSVQEIPQINFLLCEADFPVFAWLFYQVSSHPLLQLTLWSSYILPQLWYKTPSEASRRLCRNFIISQLKDGGLGITQKPKSENSILSVALERLVVLKHSVPSAHEREEVGTILTAVQNATVFVSDSSARAYFPTLLRHAAVTGSQPDEEVLRGEVCLLLAKSLQSDQYCYQTWLDAYPRLIPQSNNLLLYIMINWKSVRNLVNQSRIVSQARAIIKLNNKLLGEASGLREKNIRVCSVTCNALIKKLNSSWLPLFIYLLVLLAIIGGVMLYFNCILDGCQHQLCYNVIDCEKKL